VQPLPTGELAPNTEATSQGATHRDPVDLTADELLLDVIGTHPAPHPRPSQVTSHPVDETPAGPGSFGPSPAIGQTSKKLHSTAIGGRRPEGERERQAPPTPRCR
jgi:hypothetical protein